MAATDGVTVAMLDCLAVAVDEADAALEILQDKLLPSVNSELETKLHVAHEEWAAYRASTCQAEAAAAGSGSFSNGGLSRLPSEDHLGKVEMAGALIGKPGPH
ncbi:lysozyme inhibitor LprI family protein [Devosia sp. SD17-2]|uniref:lysozyme inhibitor LprI family protein n=1 Tax=Devosia sp. SD17-2 TaxID=2976459 RepID=UPI0023D8C7BC|nr:lysozyme inhibitor LprI family protein [Devosia sp. SD17-2]WEJ34096.1 lysozyme inhibitor LprI family protein [Devosia sp. SD17-2]